MFLHNPDMRGRLPSGCSRRICAVFLPFVLWAQPSPAQVSPSTRSEASAAKCVLCRCWFMPRPRSHNEELNGHDQEPGEVHPEREALRKSRSMGQDR